jgi:hypothetical protein
LRIENTSHRELRLSEPSSFILEDSKLEARKRSSEGFDASARLWDFLPKTSKQRENFVLQPGESFQCKIDLKELAWNRSKSSVYHYATDDPAWYLLNAVPTGRYTLYFELTSPPIVIRHTLTDRLFRSNELSVTLKR